MNVGRRAAALLGWAWWLVLGCGPGGRTAVPADDGGGIKVTSTRHQVLQGRLVLTLPRECRIHKLVLQVHGAAGTLLAEQTLYPNVTVGQREPIGVCWDAKEAPVSAVTQISCSDGGWYQYKLAPWSTELPSDRPAFAQGSSEISPELEAYLEGIIAVVHLLQYQLEHVEEQAHVEVVATVGVYLTHDDVTELQLARARVMAQYLAARVPVAVETGRIHRGESKVDFPAVFMTASPMDGLSDREPVPNEARPASDPTLPLPDAYLRDEAEREQARRQLAAAVATTGCPHGISGQ